MAQQDKKCQRALEISNLVLSATAVGERVAFDL
jgi:hypothetical protein